MTAAFAAALAIALSAPAVYAQKALVYCPVGVDASGCDRIVTALQSRFPDGVDRGYDGSNSTVDLESVDLQHYGVFVVPSLADDAVKQPYAMLHSVASRLRFAINGRVAVYSGAPDQGRNNRTDKDALIQNLALWAANGHSRATGLVGLVAFLDLSEQVGNRYSWVRDISLADVAADAELQAFSDVTPLSARGGNVLSAGGAAVRFANMASYGLHIGRRAAARTEVGALGGGSKGQSVLVMYSNADGKDDATSGATTGQAGSTGASLDVTGVRASLSTTAGTASTATTSGPAITTDKPDYQPGDTVTFAGNGFAPGDTVTITVHEDPTWSYPDRQFTSVADGNGAFVNRQMVVDKQDLGVTFTATAVGNPSGLVAQTTFTDGSIQSATVVTETVTAGPACTSTQATTFASGSSVCADVSITVQGGGPGPDARVQWYQGASPTPVRDTPYLNLASGTTNVQDIFAPPAGSWTIKVCKTGNAGACSNGNTVVTAQFTVIANTPPVATNDTYSTNEDNALTVAAAGVLGNDTDAENNALTAVLVTGPSHGTLTLNADGSFTYTPNANYNGSDSFTYNANDGTTNSTTAATVNITVNAVNDAPSFTKGADQTVLEDATAQTIANWATAISAGPSDESGQTVDFVVSNNNNALFSVQPSIAANGTLTYTPAANANGNATVTVHIHDNGGTANSGVDASADQTFTIDVTAVNDAPSFTKGTDQTVNEDASAQAVSGWATAISAGPADEAGQTLSFVVTGNTNAGLFAAGPAISAAGNLTYTPAANANGTATITIKLTDNGGVANGGVDASAEQTFVITVNPVNDAPSFTKGADQTVNEDAGAQTVNAWATAISAGPSEGTQTVAFAVTNDNNALFSAQPSVDASGKLTYTPAADAFGAATITVTLKDDGGTANGGVDTSAPQTFTITVNAVNDAPSFTKGADQTVLEDAGAQSAPGWATGISVGPANESSQTVSFHVTGNTNPSLFSSGPAIAANGTLTYTGAPDAFGMATITITAQDNGGTSNGGVDTSAPQTFTITITAVNDAPTFNLIASHTVLEDAGAQSVSGALTSQSPGPTNEAGQTLIVTVTNDNNALFSIQPSIDLSTGVLSYTPAANANGSAVVTVKLKDNGGTANGGVDETTKTLTITVTSVNDAPSFSKGADQTSLEDAGPQSVSGWATAISAGPSDEAAQVLDFIVTNDNTGLFSVQPAISATGQLTYSAAPNANGSATVTVKLHDNGGTANGGQDTSPDQTFTITITAVNDAPSFAKGADQTVLEDAAAQTISNWATAISAGPADESGQVVDFVVSNNNTSLFSVQPAIAANGTLTYTPAADAFGVATVTVHAHDNGGTLNGGVNVSADQTFTITITSVNDAPSFTKGPDQTKLEDAGAQTIPGWATNVSKGPANESSQTLIFTVTNDNNALFSTQPAINASGQLTYTSATNANGSATVSVVLKDDGGTADGGVDTAPTQTFTITITPVNDAPTFNLIASHTVLEDAGAQSVANALSSPSPGPANESGQTLALTVTNNNGALFSVTPAIDGSGTLTYTPAANANGSATVTVKLKDNGGTANGGVDETIKTLTITVTPVNDAPLITDFSSPLPPNAVNTSVSASGVFQDVDLGDSPPDSHTGTIDWGDGATTAASITGSTGTTRNFSGSHTYTSAGVYKLTAVITDAASATSTSVYQYVVVYDPSAGFVTGGGWIMSPLGAYAADPSLTGKANFGFVSKYQKGQSTPSGNTEFQFQAGNLNFKSMAYDWLVISGARAQYKGTGTINGQGNYGFILTAIDSDVNGGGTADRFRIKIWDINNGGTIVYDNQMNTTDDAGLTTPGTLLGGGSIQIHSK